MTGGSLFDPFAALAAAKAKSLSQPPEETLAELSQPAAELKCQSNHDVAEKFATFATLARARVAPAENSSGQDIRKKERFSLSFQGLTTGGGKPWLASKARRMSDGAGTPARVAILRENETNLCYRKGNYENSSARVLREFGRGADEGPDPALGVARVDQATSDERAGFLEYDCGLPREDAEKQARAEMRKDPATSRSPLADLPDCDGLELWAAGLALLKLYELPCPGYRLSDWPRVYARAQSFLDHFGEQAEALGWTAPRLFGVHPTAGIVRVDCCGALVLPIGGPVRAITASEVAFGHLTHRAKPGQPEGAPIWSFGR